jgi:hypothetical protein
VEDIKRVTSETATSRDEPKNAAGLAEAVEGMTLTKLTFSALETAMPGLKRPSPREVLERVFMKVVDERYGGMTDFAAEFAQQNFGVAF